MVDQQLIHLRKSGKLFFVLSHEQNADNSVRQQSCMQFGLVIYNMNVVRPYQGGWYYNLVFAEPSVPGLGIERWFLSSLGLTFSSFSEHKLIQYLG